MIVLTLSTSHSFFSNYHPLKRQAARNYSTAKPKFDIISVLRTGHVRGFDIKRGVMKG
ncbi:MAG: hypothetical protein M3264_04545 [Thermoproteota archaeon]|nr:hypothetical protein [Thermoproteota archaeon]